MFLQRLDRTGTANEGHAAVDDPSTLFHADADYARRLQKESDDANANAEARDFRMAQDLADKLHREERAAKDAENERLTQEFLAREAAEAEAGERRGRKKQEEDDAKTAALLAQGGQDGGAGAGLGNALVSKRKRTRAPAQHVESTFVEGSDDETDASHGGSQATAASTKPKPRSKATAVAETKRSRTGAGAGGPLSRNAHRGGPDHPRGSRAGSSGAVITLSGDEAAGNPDGDDGAGAGDGNRTGEGAAGVGAGAAARPAEDGDTEDSESSEDGNGWVQETVHPDQPS